MRKNLRAAGLAAGLTVALSAAAPAASPPHAGHLDFDVMRNGKDIGDHSYAFSRSSTDLTVKVRTDVRVRVPLIRTTVYSFTHESTEDWRNGTLARLTSVTNDDGEPHRLELGAEDVLPASLWSDNILGATRLLNTINGQIMSVSMTNLGTEAVTTGHGAVNARHYRISGDLERDVWYDNNGLLAGLSMTAEDGSSVTYRRK